MTDATATEKKPPDFSARGIEAFKGYGERAEYRDPNCAGLTLTVSPTGKKAWQVAYRFNGERRKKALGATDVVPLAKAREAVKEIRRAVTEGRDPEAVAAAAAETADEIEKRKVSALWKRFDKQGFKKQKASAGTKTKWNAFYEKKLAAWHDRDVKTIKKDDCLVVIEAADARGKFAANFAYTVLNSFFNWLAGRGLIDESPMASLTKPYIEDDDEGEGGENSKRKINDSELAAIWNAGDKNAFGKLVRMLIATGQRRTEVANMEWSEVDLVNRYWILPASRSKNKRANLVYLNDQAMAVLNSIPRNDDDDDDKNAKYIFSTTEGRAPLSGFSKMKTAFDKVAGVPDWRLHDLRRVVATNMQRLAIDFAIRQACRNHKIRGLGARYELYDYKDEKRAAWIRWSSLLTRITAGDAKAVAAFVATFQPPEAVEATDAANVVALRAPGLAPA